MLEILNVVVLLFKVLLLLLVLAVFFWFAPALILDVIEERRVQKTEYHGRHKRHKRDDGTMYVVLVERLRSARETADIRDSDGFLSFQSAEPAWSI